MPSGKFFKSFDNINLMIVTFSLRNIIYSSNKTEKMYVKKIGRYKVFKRATVAIQCLSYVC